MACLGNNFRKIRSTFSQRERVTVWRSQNTTIFLFAKDGVMKLGFYTCHNIGYNRILLSFDM
jgi:hypothetical protein